MTVTVAGPCNRTASPGDGPSVRKIRIVAVLGVVLALLAGITVVVATVIRPGAPPAQVAAGTHDLSGTAPTDVALSDTWTVRVPAGGVPAAGARLDVTPLTLDTDGFLQGADLRLSTGQPLVPWTFVYRGPAPDGPLFLFSDREGGGTDLLPAQWNAERTEATVEVAHLSPKWWEDLAGAVTNVAGKIFGQRTDEPTCTGQAPDWVDDAVFVDDVNNPMLSCVGRDPKDASVAVVKIAANRGGALVVTAPVAPAWSFEDRELGPVSQVPAKLLGAALDTVAERPMPAGRSWLVLPGDELHLGFTEAQVRSVPAPFSVSGRFTTTGLALGVITTVALDALGQAGGYELALATVCLTDAASGALGDGLLQTVYSATSCALDHPAEILGKLRDAAGTLPPGAARAAEAAKKGLGLVGKAAYAGFVITDLLTTMRVEPAALQVSLFPRAVRRAPAATASEWSRRGTVLKLAADGTGSIEYFVRQKGCTPASDPRQQCYFNARLQVRSSTADTVTGTLTRTWFAEGSTPVAPGTTVTIADEAPVGGEFTLRIDAARDLATYTDAHGGITLCGRNDRITKSGCS